MPEVSHIFDYNIEFAHVGFDEDCNFNEKLVLESAKIAKRKLETLERHGASYCVCILIDDKHVKNGLTYKNVSKFLNFVQQYMPRIDFICFEKRLEDYMDQVIEMLDSSKKDTIAGKIYRYRRKHKGKLGCSHDIAVWHLMRLGIVNNIDNQTLVYVGSGESGKRGQRKQAEFVSRRVISILSKSDKEQEEKADREILRHCRHIKIRRQIKRIYFDTETKI